MRPSAWRLPSCSSPRRDGGACRRGGRAHQHVFARLSGIDRSRAVVAKLSALFALDSFGGGFVVQSFAAYWFYLRFGVEPRDARGAVLRRECLRGSVGPRGGALARRIGLLNTMVVTHLPSNVVLMLIPLMPTLPLATCMLLLRFSISQMDVPTRQSYTMAVVPPEERSAAAGITGVARTTGAALSPLFAGWLFGTRPCQRAVLHRRRVEDRLRHPGVPRVPIGQAAGGGRSAAAGFATRSTG